MAVNEEINIKYIDELGWLKFIIRKSIYTPAVTKVEEWTRAEIGVGADIAAGNHAEKGNCALFDKAAIIIIIKIIMFIFSFIEKFQFIIINIIAILNRIIISPTRLDKIVIEPDAEDEAFW